MLPATFYTRIENYHFQLIPSHYLATPFMLLPKSDTQFVPILVTVSVYYVENSRTEKI